MTDTMLHQPQLASGRTGGIEVRIGKPELDRLLLSERNAGAVASAHWFRNADYWYRLNYGYNNPLNVGTVHAEMFFLQELADTLRKYLAGRALHFYGVGVGDTEMVIADIALAEQEWLETSIVDVNPMFIKLFLSSLANRKLEFPAVDIQCVAYRDLFERMRAVDFSTVCRRAKSNMLVCLGSSIGNYTDVQATLKMFARSMKPADLLLLTYQLDNHLSLVFDRYAQNELYRDLIGNYLSEVERRQIDWVLDSEASTVRAYLHDVELFRSKKFSPSGVESFGANVGLQTVLREEDRHENLCIHILEKTAYDGSC